MATLKERLQANGRPFPNNYWSAAGHVNGACSNGKKISWVETMRTAKAGKLEYKRLVRAAVYARAYYSDAEGGIDEDAPVTLREIDKRSKFGITELKALYYAGAIPKLPARGNAQRTTIWAAYRLLPLSRIELRKLLINAGCRSSEPLPKIVVKGGLARVSRSGLSSYFGLYPWTLFCFAPPATQLLSEEFSLSQLERTKPAFAVSEAGTRRYEQLRLAMENAERKAAPEPEADNGPHGWLSVAEAESTAKLSEDTLRSLALLGILESRQDCGLRISVKSLDRWEHLTKRQQREKTGKAFDARMLSFLPSPLPGPGGEITFSLGQVCDALGIPYRLVSNGARAYCKGKLTACFAPQNGYPGGWKQEKTRINAIGLVQLERYLVFSEAGQKRFFELLAVLYQTGSAARTHERSVSPAALGSGAPQDAEALTSPAPETPPPAKPGLFSRLFGKRRHAPK